VSDKIDDAIAATVDDGPTIEMMGIPVQLSSSGRPARVDLPADVTDAELIDLIGWLGTTVRAAARERAAGAASRLFVPARLRQQ
jgi:hypothetical protein